MGYLYPYFSDTSCSTPLYETSSPVLAALHYVSAYDATSCQVTGYYTLGAAFTGTPYTNSSSTCVAAPVDAMHAYYGVSAFGVTGFQSGTMMGNAGPFAGFASGTRMQLATVDSGDGARANGGWHDALLAEDCELYAALDSVLRCIPSSLTYVSDYFFSDAACSVPLIEGGSCGATPHYAATQGCSRSYLPGRRALHRHDVLQEQDQLHGEDLRRIAGLLARRRRSSEHLPARDALQ